MENLTNNPANLINDLTSIVNSNLVTINANNQLCIDYSLLDTVFNPKDANIEKELIDENQYKVLLTIFKPEQIAAKYTLASVTSKDIMRLFRFARIHNLDINLSVNSSYVPDFVKLFGGLSKQDISKSIISNELNCYQLLQDFRRAGYNHIGLQSYSLNDIKSDKSYKIRLLSIDMLLTDSTITFSKIALTLQQFHRLCKKDGTVLNIKPESIGEFLSVYQTEGLKGSRKLSNAIADNWANI